MAGKGPNRGRKKQLSTPQAAAAASQIIPIVNIRDVMSSPSQTSLEPGLIGALSTAVNSADTLINLTSKLFEIARNHNARQRELNLASFFAENNEFLKSKMEQFIFGVGYQLIKNDVPYDLIEVRLSAFNLERTKLESAKTKEAQAELTRLKALIDTKMADSENLFLLGFQKVNILQALLENPKAQAQRESMLHDLFRDLAPATSFLITRFTQTALTEHHYYFYYQIILEKIQLLERYVDEYQDQFCKKLKSSPGLLQNADIVQREISSLLLTYRLAIAFLGLFNQQERAQALKLKAIAFVDKLLPTDCAKANISPAFLEEYKLNYNELGATLDQLSSPGQLKNLFKLLDTFYTHTWNKTSALTSPVSVVQLIQSAKETKESLKMMSDTLMPGLTFVYASSVLGILNAYKDVPKQQSTKELVSCVLDLVVALMVMFRKDPSLQTHFGKTIQGVLKQIADDLKQDLLTFSEELPLKLSAEVKEVETMITRLTLEDAPAAQETLCAPRLFIPLLSQHEQAELDKEAQILRASMTQNVTKEQEDKREQDKQKQTASFETKRQELRAQIERERNELAKRLQEENLAKLKALEISQSDELNAEREKAQQQFAKFKEKKERQFNTKKAELLAVHQKKMTEIQAQVQDERQKLTASQQKSLSTLIDQHKAELDSLSSKQASTLKDLSSQYQSELAARTEQAKANIRQVNERHEAALLALNLEQESKLKAQATQHQAKLAKLNEQQQTELSALAALHQAELSKKECDEQASFELLKQKLLDEQRKKEEEYAKQLKQRQNELEAIHKQEIEKLQQSLHLKHPSLKAVHFSMPIARFELPPQMALLRDLEAHQLESYMVGGWVRNRLLGIPPMLDEDMDIIVNCSPDELPQSFKSRCWQNPNDARHLKFGKVDIWCERWGNLKDFLNTKDFSINTFVCSSNGDVFDLLGAQGDLSAPTLKLLGDPKLRFAVDPSLIMRMIRFANQFAKDIPCEDLIKEHANRIRYLPIGIYLNNMQKLFVSQISNTNLSTVLRLGILADVFPTLPQQLPPNSEFWEHKLGEFAYYPERFDYYHVLALFLMMPVVLSNPKRDELPLKLQTGIEAFFANFKGTIDEGEKEKIRKTLSSIVLSKHGFYDQYEQFEAQKVVISASPAPIIHQYKKSSRRHSHHKAQAPAPSPSPSLAKSPAKSQATLQAKR